MSKQDFDKFIAGQKQKEIDKFDPEKQLSEWKGHLDNLYAMVEGFMESYVQQGSAIITYTERTLTEDFSGPYSVKQLNLQVGNSAIAFKPIGTMLIGSKGRVDVQGPRGIFRLTLVDKLVKSGRDLIKITTTILEPGQKFSPPEQSPTAARDIEWVWKIASPPPNIQLQDLEETTFFDKLLSVLDV